MAKQAQSAGIVSSVSPRTEAPDDPAPHPAAAGSASMPGATVVPAPLSPQAVRVPGAVLLDVDALTHQVCGEIETLAEVTIDTLALNTAALIQARQLLLLIRDRAQTLRNCVNVTAEEHGCNVEKDEALWAFVHGLRKRGTPPQALAGVPA